MGSFGENLRREREARGITLEAISKTTKISVRLLQAIESEDFDRLPGGVFNVNFVRQYAHQVGLDEDRVVTEFRALTHDPAEEAAATPQSLPPPDPEYDWDAERRGRLRIWATVALLVVGGLAGAYHWMRQQSAEPAPAPTPPPVASQTPPPQAEPKVEPPPLPPQPEAPAPALAAQPDGPNAPVRVELLAHDMVWVTAAADGKVVFTTTLQPEQRRVASAQERVRIRVGNAGALKVILNGQEQPPIGPAGQPRTVLFTPEGMQVVPPAEKPAEPKEAPTDPPR